MVVCLQDILIYQGCIKISVNLLTVNVQAEDREAKRYKIMLTDGKWQYLKKILQFIQFSRLEKLDPSSLSSVSLILISLSAQHFLESAHIKKNSELETGKTCTFSYFCTI